MGEQLSLTVPLYRQISDELQRGIESGYYKEGERLPSEKALSLEKQVAVGTVRNAYEELQKKGLIRKVRGGGAYVLGRQRQGEAEAPPPEPELLVEHLVNSLYGSGLSAGRIVKLLQREIDRAYFDSHKLKTALVDCNYETLHNIVEDFKQLPELDLELFTLDELLSGKKVIDSQVRLALVSQRHYGEFVRYADLWHLKVEEVAIREKRETIARLTVIPPEQTICILYRSPGFLASVRYTLEALAKENRVVCMDERKLTEGSPLHLQYEALIAQRVPLVIPPDYMSYGSAFVLQLIERAGKTGSVAIPFEFEVDKGTKLYLKQMLRRMQEIEQREMW